MVNIITFHDDTAVVKIQEDNKIYAAHGKKWKKQILRAAYILSNIYIYMPESVRYMFIFLPVECLSSILTKRHCLFSDSCPGQRVHSDNGIFLSTRIRTFKS